MNVNFELITAEKNQVEILYDLLRLRVHSISHQSLPDFAEHSAFVHACPYRAWYLIRDDSGYIGSVYVTDQNTIGINVDERKIKDCLSSIIDKIKSEFEPLPSIKSVRAGCFSVNVPSSSGELLSALIRSGCSIAQVTVFV